VSRPLWIAKKTEWEASNLFQADPDHSECLSATAKARIDDVVTSGLARLGLLRSLWKAIQPTALTGRRSFLNRVEVSLRQVPASINGMGSLLCCCRALGVDY
jgi:hypothetical protein